VRNGALGFTGAMQDLPAYTAGGSTLMVFALPRPEAPQSGAPLPAGAGTPTPSGNQSGDQSKEPSNAPSR